MGDVSENGERLRKAFYRSADIVNNLPSFADPCSNIYADPVLDIVDSSGGGIPREFWDIFLVELKGISSVFSED